MMLPTSGPAATEERWMAKGSRNSKDAHRLGMVDEEVFYKTVENLRKVGAKRISLKTGAYRPADLARAG